MTFSASTCTPRVVRADDGRQLFAAGVAHDQFEEEAIELCFGQRIGAFLLDRILRGHDKERLLQLEPLAGRRDGPFLHRFEHGRLRLGCGAIDFVGQADLREDGALLELKHAPALRVFDHHVGAQDIGGHQIGRELNAREVKIERRGQRPHQQGLPQSGHAFQADSDHRRTGR